MFEDLKVSHSSLIGELWLCPSVQKTILCHRQSGFFSREAGGILMGYRRGPHIEVVNVTTPLPLDICKRRSFERKDPGHQRICDSWWASSGGKMHYLGEWHTHPEMRPAPSCVDQREWGKLKKKYCDPLVFVIAGTREWYIELLSCNWVITSPAA